MTTLIETLYEGNVFPILCLIAILMVVGGKMAQSDIAVRQWGRRLAGLGFFAYAVYAGVMFRANNEDDWLHVVIRAVLAGGLLMGTSWIVLSILAFTGRYLKQASDSLVQIPVNDGLRRKQAEESREMQASQQRRAAEDRQSCAIEASRKNDENRRRDDARMHCLMLYDRNSELLADQFPRERLQEYVDHYMSDSSAAEIVEQRAQTLTSMIDNWVAQSKSRQQKQYESLAELAAFFQRQREEVNPLPYDTDVKDSLLSNINIQEEEAVRRFLS